MFGPGPCSPWTSEAAVRGMDGGCSGAEGCAPWNDVTRFPSGVVAQWIAAASDVMFQLLGRRWPGGCEATVTPVCAQHHRMAPLPIGGGVEMLPVPYVRGVDGWWGGFLCAGSRRVRLDGYPVLTVDEVLIAGEVLDPAAYDVRDHRWLVRVDGGRWPHVWYDHPDPEAFLVTFLYGGAPPAMAERAAMELSRQMLLASCADGSCTLLPQVRSVVREGVTLDFIVAGLAEALKGGFTGVPAVDLAITAHNPNGLRRRARVLVPGSPRNERRTWPST